MDPLVVPVRVAGDAEACAFLSREYANSAGLPARAQWEVSIAASELATNVLKFAASGTMTLTFDEDVLTLEVIDEGRGIEKLDDAITDGWSNGRTLGPDCPRGQGLGVGLGTVHRMMDHVKIDTRPSRGTRIVAVKKRQPR